MSRRSFSLAERQRYLALYRRSGLSHAQFCRRHELAPTTLGNWKSRLGRKASSVRFQRVRISPLAWAGENAVAELVLAGGVRVRVMRDCPSEQLAGILEAVGTCGR
jgi:transposase-like protein